MSHPVDPTPDFDPYFIPEGRGPKGLEGKCGPPGDEEVRRDLMPTEAAFRVAGTIGMVLGALFLVFFALAVSLTLREAREAGGFASEEDWLWRRWVARMASMLALTVLGAATSSGLRRRRPWSRWALIVLGAVPPSSMVAGLGLAALSRGPSPGQFAEMMTSSCVAVMTLPASVAALWSACTRRGRAVLSPYHERLVARTPKQSPGWTMGLGAGLGLAGAMFILCWTLLLAFLGILVGCGVIRSI